MEQPSIFSFDKYIIDQKLLSLRSTYIIRDPDGNEIGKAVRKIISLGPKITVYDKDDKAVARIEGKFITLRKTMKFYDRENKLRGIMKRKLFKFLGSEYRIENDIGKRIATIKGNFSAYEYKVYNVLGQEAVRISKKRLSIRDSYGVEILDPKFDRVLALLIPIAIDTIEHE